jgi:hypothetical protein
MQYSSTGVFNDKILLSVRYELNMYIMLIQFILKGVEVAAGTTCCEGRAGRRSMRITVCKM